MEYEMFFFKTVKKEQTSTEDKFKFWRCLTDECIRQKYPLILAC